MSQTEGVPELQGPPEVLEAIDTFLADPSTGELRGRPVRQGVEEGIDEAEIEDQDSEDESFVQRHWLLIAGLGIVFIGLAIRWYYRRR